MSFKKIIAYALVLSCVGTAWGAVSPEESKQLGQNLTPIGAEKAGNKEGTIPAWTGVPIPVPASYKKGSGIRPDPFAHEKSLFSINAQNMGKYGDKLTEGAKALLKKYPKTFHMDVYPTHRTTVLPQYVYDNSVKNIGKAKIVGDTLEGAHAMYPFPTPKTGLELIWNKYAIFQGIAAKSVYESVSVDSVRETSVSTTDVTYNHPYHDMNSPKDNNMWMYRIDFTAPPYRAGESMLIKYGTEMNILAWIYLPGQRRVKLAPEVGYDTPNTVTSGTSTYDECWVFNGHTDRYNFKILGKKEMYVPYNCYKIVYNSTKKDAFKPNHVNPDYMRWELHRVWVVEASLKPGKRHIYPKRIMYLDEDSYAGLAGDNYDARGQLFRTVFDLYTYSYDVQAAYFDPALYIDLIGGTYNVNGYSAEAGGIKYRDKLWARKEHSPDHLAGAGVR